MTRAKPRTARDVALDVLVRVDDGAYSNLVLPSALARSNLELRDRAFATDLVYGTLRSQGRNDSALVLHCDRPLQSLDPVVRAALRMGVYQLRSGVAPHAAVSATVDACSARLPKARGFVNAILRRVSDTPDTAPTDGNTPDVIAARTMMPRWIVELAEQRFGDSTEEVLASMNEIPSVTLRVDRGNPAEVADELRNAGATVEPGALMSNALRVRGTGDPAQLPVVRDGRATPQDEGSQAVVAVVGAQAGDRVLDLAAAPGGKTTGIAAAVGPSGLVVASDLVPGRAARVAQAVHRIGLSQCVVLVADGRALPLRASFDRVLLDAPCSGLGVLRRRAEARWRVQPGEVGTLAARQRELLVAAATQVRPGGVLTYAVCTFTIEETDAVVEWAVRELPEFRLLPTPDGFWQPTASGGALLAPGPTDGMFVAQFE
ncbi:MAG: transcription antitermination factor NusB, partial [Acidimicrobiia bacterium]